MSAVDRDAAVRFRFGDCDALIVVRTILTAADHLCAGANISIALLDALEVPLTESLVSLNSSSVASAVVDVVDDELRLEIGVRQPLPEDSTDLFGDAAEIIDAFFSVDRGSDGHRVSLVGSLS